MKWIKRELVGKLELDQLPSGLTTVLKAFKKDWEDGSSCLDIMKYVKVDNGNETCYHPVQHIQIPWELDTVKKLLKLFETPTVEGKIKGADLIDCALKEFWHEHPGQYGNYMYLLGHRLSQVGDGYLDQDEYIQKWKDHPKPTDEAINEDMKRLNELEAK